MFQNYCEWTTKVQVRPDLYLKVNRLSKLFFSNSIIGLICANYEHVEIMLITNM